MLCLWQLTQADDECAVSGQQNRFYFIFIFLFFHPFWHVNCDFSQFSLKLQETKTFFFANRINGHLNSCLTQEVNTIYCLLILIEADHHRCEH